MVTCSAPRAIASSKGRHFHASYDEFWQSIDGQPESPGAGGYRYVWKEIAGEYRQ